MKASMEMWQHMNGEIGRETGFRQTGVVFATTDTSALERWESWLQIAREFDLDSRLLLGNAVSSFIPGSADRWAAAMYTASDGRAEPGLAVPAIAEAAVALGATVHQECAVRSLDMEGGKVAGVVTEKGLVRARAVLCAGGAWASMFCRMHDVKLVQAGVVGTAFRTTPAPEVVMGALATSSFSMRRRLDGAYTIGLTGRGSLELSPQGIRFAKPFWPTFKARRSGLSFRVRSSFFNGPESLQRWGEDQVSPFERMRVYHPAPDARLVQLGISELRRQFPTLQNVRVDESWASLIDSTPDGIPVISPVGSVPGLFLSTGFSGHGFGIGPAAGRLAADLIMGSRPIVDPYPYRHSRMVDGSNLGAPGMM